MREQIVEASAGGMWSWILQRLTAVVLLFGLAVHLIALHILNIGDLTYDNVAGRLASYFFIVTDFSLLFAGVFHALNGVRMVLLDYGFSGGSRHVLAVGLWAFGLAAVAYGTWALWPWLTS